MVLLRQKSGWGEDGKSMGNDRTKKNGRIDKLVWKIRNEGIYLGFMRKRKNAGKGEKRE